MKGVTIWGLKQLMRSACEGQTEIGGRWMPCRCIGWEGLPYRLKAAWLVFTGKADAVIWPGGQ